MWLSKVGSGEEMDIPGEGVRLPQVKKTGNRNQEQADKGKERIRPVLPTSRKSRYGLTMRKHLQEQKT